MSSSRATGPARLASLCQVVDPGPGTSLCQVVEDTSFPRDSDARHNHYVK